MCHLSKKDQYVCQINQGIAEAVTGVLGGAQFPSCPFYHPRSSRCRLGHTREAAVCAGNFPDSNGISDDFKRQKRSHQNEPVHRLTNSRKSNFATEPRKLPTYGCARLCSTRPLSALQARRSSHGLTIVQCPGAVNAPRWA